MTAAVVATTLNRMAMATAAFTIVSISCAVHGRLRRCCRAVGIEPRERLTALSAVGHGTLYTPKRSVGVGIASAC